MKKKYSYILLLIVSCGFAQIPTGYYNNATGSGFTLKTQLYNIISPHTTLVYGSGLWALYPSSDVRPDGKVWDIYSNCNFTFGLPANGGNQDIGTGGNVECQFFNKEHTFPKSWFGGVNGTAMYSDAFHVMPTDKKNNSLRGNLAYGLVDPAVTNSIGNGWKIGNCVAPNYPYSYQVFEPANEYKGDLARNYFYMATCYEDQISTWQTLNVNGDTVLDGSANKVFEQWYLDLMFAWHTADPVSQKEIDRNNAIYAVQGNRNPYIDHPEWVYRVWGNYLNNVDFDKLTAVTIYPNPATEHTISINTDITLDQIDLITINGQLIQIIKNPKIIGNNYKINDIPQGFYFMKLTANNQTVTKKIIVN
jgi:endonuclease I